MSGTVSAKYAEGTEEELGLAGVSVNGIAAALGEVDGNRNVGFATVGAVNSETACVGSIMPLIMELCWTNVNGELVFPGVDAVTNNCPQVPLGLLEGYEVVEYRNAGWRVNTSGDPNSGGMIFIQRGDTPRGGIVSGNTTWPG